LRVSLLAFFKHETIGLTHALWGNYFRQSVFPSEEIDFFLVVEVDDLVVEVNDGAGQVDSKLYNFLAQLYILVFGDRDVL